MVQDQVRCALTEQGREKVFSSDDALTADAFAALMDAFAPFPPERRLAVAVSGGPDSMALAFCLRRWTATATTPLAFIVDHALRPGSAAEAETTRQRLQTIGMRAEILRWEHDPILTKIHVAARQARYELLGDASRRHGITDLLLAHHVEDQAETVLMRLAKGSGVDGLAGMRVQTRREGINLLRPLLNVPKARLIALCRDVALEFIDDTSNQSEQFARGRLRRLAPLLAAEGLTPERLADLATRAGHASDALEHYAAQFLAASSRRGMTGALRIDLEALRRAPREIAGRALDLCLRAVHSDTYVSEYASSMRLLDGLLT
ncbi:MAG: tRNA lysidine(34) synthetase TilS, partial [Pseudomonadota bacterium]|nr:tRNA lysidine(34) synthetase TilS [Pseudomonadota bacterium]